MWQTKDFLETGSLITLWFVGLSVFAGIINIIYLSKKEQEQTFGKR